MTSKCIFSIDVEDWFHILDLPATPDIAAWDALPSRVEKNFHALLDLLDEKPVKASCFFLGYVAKRYPHLVREAAARGHEVASHGYAHRLVYTQTAAEFLEDVRSARETIEQAAGRAVHGYRSPGFSITDATPWFFEKVREAGYRYDSSVFPAKRAFGGLPDARREPYVMADAGDLVEFPISVARVLGKPICFFGGGYLRLFPYGVIRLMSRQVLGEGLPIVFYVHPREVDPRQPRLPMSRVRAFKSYVNLRTTENKIRRIIEDFELTTFEGFLAERGQTLARA